MAKFKVGDVVRVKVKETFGMSFREDNFGVVRKTVGGEIASVDFFRGMVFPGHDCQMPDIIPDRTGWNLYFDELEKIDYTIEYKGFHIGDRVETITEGSVRGKGFTGTIVGFKTGGLSWIMVRFDEKNKPYHGCSLAGTLDVSSELGGYEYLSDIKVIHSIVPIKEKDTNARCADVTPERYTETEKKCIEKIKKLLTF